MKLTRRELRHIIRESLTEADSDAETAWTLERVIELLESGKSILGMPGARKAVMTAVGKTGIELKQFKYGQLIFDNLKALLINIEEQIEEEETPPINAAKIVVAIKETIKETIGTEDVAAIITPILLAAVPGGRLIDVVASGLIELGLEAAAGAFRDAMLRHAIKKGIRDAIPLAGDFQTGPNKRVGSLAEGY